MMQITCTIRVFSIEPACGASGRAGERTWVAVTVRRCPGSPTCRGKGHDLPCRARGEARGAYRQGMASAG